MGCVLSSVGVVSVPTSFNRTGTLRLVKSHMTDEELPEVINLIVRRVTEERVQGRPCVHRKKGLFSDTGALEMQSWPRILGP